MWRRARLALVAVGTAAAAVAAGPALACSCAFSRSPAEQIARTDVVFVGVVLGSTGDGSHAVTTFRVDEVLKGPAAKELVVQHAVSSAACGLKFTSGSRRLVFAHRSHGKLGTNSCSQPRFSEADYRAAIDRNN